MEGSSRIGTSSRLHKGGMGRDGVMDITVGNKEDGEFGSVQGSSFSRTSSRSSYDDDDDDDNPASLSHEEAVRREKARIVQRRLYSRGKKGFPYSVDLANSVKRILNIPKN
jgi:hypothetical protein